MKIINLVNVRGSKSTVPRILSKSNFDFTEQSKEAKDKVEEF